MTKPKSETFCRRFLMLCPMPLSWVRNPTQTCHAEQLRYLHRLGELTGERSFSDLFERIVQCGFWAQVTEGNYCGAQHERVADPWKKVSRDVDSKGTLCLNELSLDANLHLLEMGKCFEPMPTTTNLGIAELKRSSVGRN